MVQRRHLLSMTALLAAPAAARAQAWPTRPVSLVVPWAAGGGADTVTRIFANGLEQELGQPVNVVNRTGGNGVTGHAAIANAAPDGYTIGTGTSEFVNFKTLGVSDFGPGNLDLMSRLATIPAGVTVQAQGPWRDFAAFAAALRESRRGQITGSGVGIGGSWHLAAAGMCRALGLEADRIRWIPSNGGAPALQDLAAGGIGVFTGSPIEAQPLAGAGRVRVLAIMGEERLSTMPEVPTLREAGLGLELRELVCPGRTARHAGAGANGAAGRRHAGPWPGRCAGAHAGARDRAGLGRTRRLRQLRRQLRGDLGDAAARPWAGTGMSEAAAPFDLPIIDAHHHFWDLGRNPHPWLRDLPMIPFRYGDYSALRGRDFLPAEYDAAAAGLPIVASVTMEGEWDPADPLGEARWITELAARTGRPAAHVAQAWLDRADLGPVLEGLARLPLVKGVRHKPRAAASPTKVVRGAPGSMGDPRWRAGYAQLAAHGLHFELQTPWWHLDEALDLVAAYPDTPLVLNHTGLPADRSPAGLAGWRAAMQRLATATQVSVKISGLGLCGQPWRADGQCRDHPRHDRHLRLGPLPVRFQLPGGRSLRRHGHDLRGLCHGGCPPTMGATSGAVPRQCGAALSPGPRFPRAGTRMPVSGIDQTFRETCLSWSPCSPPINCRRSVVNKGDQASYYAGHSSGLSNTNPRGP